ncbi:hypothetical protein A9Q81_17345 [Gammaproteobacteria bacterium 42_54_T18]|nr:hypothetical protein A9Q81_17345 [Gammaproteobacteria bacterium 42_54_T18]
MNQQSIETKTYLLDAFFLHRNALINSAASIVGCRYFAEDVVQDTYIKISQMTIPVDIQKPESYLFRLVRNVALDKHRRLALERQYHTSEEAGVNEAAPGESPEKKVFDLGDLQIVADALSELPERSRRAIELHRLQGVTQKQIAKELGVSATLVNFMIRDALAHCRKCLQA